MRPRALWTSLARMAFADPIQDVGAELVQNPCPRLRDAVYRLRAEAWRARVPIFPALESWRDGHDETASHFVIVERGAPIAAARLNTSPQLGRCPRCHRLCGCGAIAFARHCCCPVPTGGVCVACRRRPQRRSRSCARRRGCQFRRPGRLCRHKRGAADKESREPWISRAIHRPRASRWRSSIRHTTGRLDARPFGGVATPCTGGPP